LKGDVDIIPRVIDEVTCIINSTELEKQKKIEQELIAKQVTRDQLIML